MHGSFLYDLKKRYSGVGQTYKSVPLGLVFKLIIYWVKIPANMHKLENFKKRKKVSF